MNTSSDCQKACAMQHVARTGQRALSSARRGIRGNRPARRGM
ncbi:hypothetical protein C7S14_3066 [Burkholderia cepacia]|nr:hypothetical protein C7S14_3066 [Burkholderia cepacia]